MRNWRFTFRQDQCEFIIAAMDYIIARADERVESGKCAAFEQWASARARVSAVEIRDEVQNTIT